VSVAVSVDEKIAEIQARRAAKRDAEKGAYLAQQVLDLEALAALEDEHGFERVFSTVIGGWKPGEGSATLVVARLPKRSESIYKRFEQTIHKAKQGTTAFGDAGDVLARSCIVYPSEKEKPELYAATMELAAGILGKVATQIVEKVRGEVEEEKKG
jgi:hypothetical protein